MPSDELEGDATVSVVIPVRNGGQDFSSLLSALVAQRGLGGLDIVIVDSGSSDGSLDAAREHGARIVRIPPDEFSHSQSRNLGARHARGTHLLFTVQDALPSSALWVRHLLGAMKQHGVAAVSCLELPRDDADLFYKVSAWFHDKFMEVEGGDRIMSRPAEQNYFTLRRNAQLSNVACLMSRPLFLRYGFRGDFAEDLDLGLRLIRDGHTLALLGSHRVIHSHNRAPDYQLKRGYVDALRLSRLFPDFPVPPVEADQLLGDIVTLFAVVDSMVRAELEQLPVPCEIGALSDVVFDGLKTPAREAAPIGPRGQGLSDVDLVSFLRRLAARRPGIRPAHQSGDAALFKAVSGALAGVLHYMKETAAVVDGPVLEDFKACVYKSFAIQCGVLLASSFARGSAATRNGLRGIHAELVRGV